MADAPDDLGIPMKPARPAGQPAVVPPARAPTMPPRAAEIARPADPARMPAAGRVAADPQPRRTDGEVRKLIVGREITLSGEINSCDRLMIEGSVEANLNNCRDVDISEGGLFKGSAEIEEAEIRGRFEGNLTVRKRLLIKATGRVSGTIRYGQIEIECGGQISGDVQAQAGDDLMADVPGARAAY